MTMEHGYTLADMALPPSIHNLIKEKLLKAGYDHAVLKNDMLDMQGIGIVQEEMERSKATIEMLGHINDTPFLISLLWDMGLMPEQLVEGSFHWGYMMGIAWSHKNKKELANGDDGDE